MQGFFDCGKPENIFCLIEALNRNTTLLWFLLVIIMFNFFQNAYIAFDNVRSISQKLFISSNFFSAFLMLVMSLIM